MKRRIFGIGVARCSISRISDDGVVLWTCGDSQRSHPILALEDSQASRQKREEASNQ